MFAIFDQGEADKFYSPSSARVDIIGISYRAHEQYHPHFDKKGRISIVLRGKVHEQVSNREEIGTSMSVVVKPNTVLHSNAFGKEGAFLLSVLLKDDFQNQLESDSFFNQWQWWHPAQTSQVVLEFLKSLQLDRDQEMAVTELVAALANTTQTQLQHLPPWLARICDKIEDECFNPPSVADLAEEAGVHPVYLARAFRKFQHCNIKTYLHQCRLRRINQLLAEGRLPIAQIAFDSGYADQSHLTRYYKSQTGVTPGVFRRLVQKF